MKNSFLVFFLLSALTTASQASLFENVTLSDGSTGQVIYENGRYTSYLKEIKLSADGLTTSAVPGQVYSGVRIVKLKNGQCIKINSKLEEMKDVVIGKEKIQMPTTSFEEHGVACTDVVEILREPLEKKPQ